MLRVFKVCILVAMSLAAATKASAFALGGPLDGEDWQVPVIGYQSSGADIWGVDVASPRNFPEEYRWNTPILYYAFDAAFIDFFGSNGIVAVDQAMAEFNALTAVSSYSEQLNEFPRNSSRVNLRAQALFLLDLKSETMAFVLEQLGLLSAERWTWCLHDRLVTTPPGCPDGVTYQIVKRNYDPVTYVPSSYVNDTLFSYFIVDICQGPPPIISDAYEFPVDPLKPSSAIAPVSILQNAVGRYYTGFTRDDVGGLRYLWRTNNMNVEAVDSQATLISSTSTNGSIVQVITTSNLLALTTAAATNPPAQLLALFPGLVISSTNSHFEVVVSSNTIAFFTNYPFSPAGSPAALVVTTVFTTNFQQVFDYEFENVVIFQCYSNSTVSAVTSNTTISPFAPVGSPPVTEVTARNRVLPIPNCDFFILPTNTCNFEILASIPRVSQEVVTVTATNATATNVNGQAFTQTTITWFTNHDLLVRLTPCPPAGTNTLALRQGMEKIRFVRANFDSLLGQLFVPITTNYTLNSVSGGKVYVDTFRRTITQPDFLITASDQAGDPGDNVITYNSLSRPSPQFVQGPNVGAGPGIIQAPFFIDFEKVGPIFLNTAPFFLDQQTASQLVWWGSFDGSTNEPVVYPDSTSIRNVENQILMQVVPSSLPDGRAGLNYSVLLGGNGGQPPYTIALSAGSAGLPPGLALINSPSPAIVGTPTESGTFDFSLNLQDSSNRQVDWPFSITIEQ